MKVYILMWGGNGPCVDGVFSSPEAALIHFSERANVNGWTLDKWEPWHDRWNILDEYGGYSHRYVQAFEMDKLVR